jgi:hypothetical protein
MRSNEDRPLTEALIDLAAGIENRLAGRVPSASVSDLPEGLGFE